MLLWHPKMGKEWLLLHCHTVKACLCRVHDQQCTVRELTLVCSKLVQELCRRLALNHYCSAGLAYKALQPQQL